MRSMMQSMRNANMYKMLNSPKCRKVDCWKWKLFKALRRVIDPPERYEAGLSFL